MSKIFAELGEFLDEADRRPEAGAVDPGDERDILATAEIAVERAAKAERKRHPGLTPDRSAIGHLRTREQPDQRRLSGTIGADRKSTRLNSSHGYISYAVFCLKKKKKKI